MGLVVVLVINKRFLGQFFDHQSFLARLWCRSIAFPHFRVRLLCGVVNLSSYGRKNMSPSHPRQHLFARTVNLILAPRYGKMSEKLNRAQNTVTELEGKPGHFVEWTIHTDRGFDGIRPVGPQVFELKSLSWVAPRRARRCFVAL